MIFSGLALPKRLSTELTFGKDLKQEIQNHEIVPQRDWQWSRDLSFESLFHSRFTPINCYTQGPAHNADVAVTDCSSTVPGGLTGWPARRLSLWSISMVTQLQLARLVAFSHRLLPTWKDKSRTLLSIMNNQIVPFFFFFFWKITILKAFFPPRIALFLDVLNRHHSTWPTQHAQSIIPWCAKAMRF